MGWAGGCRPTAVQWRRCVPWATPAAPALLLPPLRRPPIPAIKAPLQGVNYLFTPAMTKNHMERVLRAHRARQGTPSGQLLHAALPPQLVGAAPELFESILTHTMALALRCDPRGSGGEWWKPAGAVACCRQQGCSGTPPHSGAHATPHSPPSSTGRLPDRPRSADFGDVELEQQEEDPAADALWRKQVHACGCSCGGFFGAGPGLGALSQQHARLQRMRTLKRK